MQRLYNLFVEIPSKQGRKLLNDFGLYTGRNVVGNHADSNLPIPEELPILANYKPGVGSVVRVAAWDPRVLSSSPVGR